jgi:hypothetical protein
VQKEQKAKWQMFFTKAYPPYSFSFRVKLSKTFSFKNEKENNDGQISKSKGNRFHAKHRQDLLDAESHQ